MSCSTFIFPKAKSTSRPNSFGNWVDIAKACSLNGSLSCSVIWEAYYKQHYEKGPRTADVL